MPKEYEGVIKYIDVDGRTKLAVKDRISRHIPNPTFNAGGACPGGQQDDPLEAPFDRRTRRVLRPRAALQADGRARHRPRADVADARQRDRGARCPTTRYAIARRRSTRSTSGCTSTGRSTTRTRSSPRRSISLAIVDKAIEELEWVAERGAKDLPHPRRRRCPRSRGRRSFALPEFDPFWDACEEPTSSSACTRPTAATSATSTSGKARPRRASTSSGRSASPGVPRAVRRRDRQIERRSSRRSSATACHPLPDA